MSLPRWIHQFYAYVFGYFWKPCPNCNRMFGGHEKGGGTMWYEGTEHSRRGMSLCPKCPGSFLTLDYDGYVTNLDERWPYWRVPSKS